MFEIQVTTRLAREMLTAFLLYQILCFFKAGIVLWVIWRKRMKRGIGMCWSIRQEESSTNSKVSALHNVLTVAKPYVQSLTLSLQTHNIKRFRV